MQPNISMRRRGPSFCSSPEQVLLRALWFAGDSGIHKF